MSGERFKGETFSRPIRPPEIKKVEHKSNKLKPTLRQKIIIKYRNTKNKIRGYFMNKVVNQADKIVKKNIPDDTWYGKVLFAILDVLPLPNIHEIWKAVQKELPDGTLKEKLALFWEKIDGVRTVIAIIVALLIALGYLD